MQLYTRTRKIKTVGTATHKTCNKCKQTKPVTEFRFDWDYSNTCIDCTNEHNRHARRNAAVREQTRKAKYNKWLENPQHRENVKEQYLRRKERLQQATPQWVDKAQIKALQEEVTRLNKVSATFDALKGKKVTYCIDHIVPLVAMDRIDGQWVQVASGLHVEWNLQIISNLDNCKKWNRLEDTQ